MYAETTEVPVERSRAEIERLLSRHKCSAFASGTDYETREIRIQFRAHGRFVRFVVALPNRADFSKNSGGDRRFAQAERQRWRALLLVIKAKLESVENAIATFEEEFLAHIILPNGETVGTMVIPAIADAYASGKMTGFLLTPHAGPDGTGK